MPIHTTVLAAEPELVEQHVISVNLDPTWSSRLPLENTTLTLTLLTYGATITHLTCPDKNGQLQDLVLGFDDWQEYIRRAKGLNPFFGATVGRTASRIAHAEFQLDGKRYSLGVSNGKDCHHGGPLGFDKRYWTTHRVDHERNAVQLRLVDVDGTNGYPGTLETLVEFRLSHNGEVEIEYEAKLLENSKDSAPESTIVSLTNHTYWNLDGVLNKAVASSTLQKSIKDDNKEETLVECSIRDHSLWLSSTKLIKLGDEHPVPTGDIFNLAAISADTNTASTQLPPCLNLSQNPEQGTLLGPGIDQIPGGYGYDHVYLLDPPTLIEGSITTPSQSASSSMHTIRVQGYYPQTPHVATLRSSLTGLSMRLLTSEPALVVYAGGYLDADQLPSTKMTTINETSSLATDVPPLQHQQHPQTHRAIMGPFSGISLEPVRIPDAIHHQEWAPMVILRKGEAYRQRSVFQLGFDH
ncbi:hypothetical protein BGW42_002674 [Actinomortierella wolfii]|nr:hypothetical protein BGW42_002674 [Actinomortierella wolfii]